MRHLAPTAQASLSMRENSDATGFPSIALPYGFGLPADKPPSPLAQTHAPGLAAVLSRLGISSEAFDRARSEAEAQETDTAGELVAAGRSSEDAIADAVAEVFSLGRRPVEAWELLPGSEDGPDTDARLRRTIGADGRPGAVIAPRLEDLDRLALLLAAEPHLRPCLRVATPRELAQTDMEASAARRLEAARLSLSRDEPVLSARQTLTGAQGFAAGLVSALVILAAITAREASLLALHIAVLPIFLGCVALRIAAAWRLLHHGRAQAIPPEWPALHPRYTVLVALRNEGADSIAALVEALSRLRWPKAKLQILLICESDDPRTVMAVSRAIEGRSRFTLVEVPPAHPRTKPKALNFALPLATGEFVVLYDAEDRPRPDQLEAAWSAFRAGGSDLACLQAPLVVVNGRQGWLPNHFAIEYRVLFSGLLPWLARHGMPLPLGGTSNHFRRDALLAVGAWDSHNVTEDADLGMRLARRGYRTGVIDPPTFEEAPERWEHWLKQRTRWMKGWMQSWLVHMRHPLRLRSELGLRDFAVFQILFAGMIASSLAHTTAVPFLLCTALMLASTSEPLGMSAVLFAFDILAVAAGYGAYAVLALATTRRRRSTLRHLWSLPFYWLLIGLATARAALQIGTQPHLWEKTPHGLAAQKRKNDASFMETCRKVWQAVHPDSTSAPKKLLDHSFKP